MVGTAMNIGGYEVEFFGDEKAIAKVEWRLFLKLSLLAEMQEPDMGWEQVWMRLTLPMMDIQAHSHFSTSTGLN